MTYPTTKEIADGAIRRINKSLERGTLDKAWDFVTDHYNAERPIIEAYGQAEYDKLLDKVKKAIDMDWNL